MSRIDEIRERAKLNLTLRSDKKTKDYIGNIELDRDYLLQGVDELSEAINNSLSQYGDYANQVLYEAREVLKKHGLDKETDK